MKLQVTKRFTDHSAAALWLEAHGYTESIVDPKANGEVVVTLEGAHAVRALEADTKAKVIVPEGV
jgi:hypothetical protein